MHERQDERSGSMNVERRAEDARRAVCCQLSHMSVVRVLRCHAARWRLGCREAAAENIDSLQEESEE